MSNSFGFGGHNGSDHPRPRHAESRHLSRTANLVTPPLHDAGHDQHAHLRRRDPAAGPHPHRLPDHLGLIELVETYLGHPCDDPATLEHVADVHGLVVARAPGAPGPAVRHLHPRRRSLLARRRLTLPPRAHARGGPQASTSTNISSHSQATWHRPAAPARCPCRRAPTSAPARPAAPACRPGTTWRRNRAPSSPPNSGSLPAKRGSASTAMAPTWAIASHISTPGSVGRPGKWPAKNHSSPVRCHVPVAAGPARGP